MRRTNGTWLTLGMPALAIGLALAATAAGEFYKNKAGQKIVFFARDMATGLPKTGDAAQITARVSIDGGVVHALVDTGASEVNATTAQGWYKFDVNQNETDGDMLLFTAGSSTSDVNLAGCLVITRAYTVDANGNIESVVKAASADANLADTTDVIDAVETGLDNQGYTVVRAAYLDYIASLGVMFSEAATAVAVVTDASQFTISAGSAVDDYYNQAIVIVTDVSDGNRGASRFIRDYIGGTKMLTLDEALPFLPAAADPVRIYLSRAVGRGRVSP